LAAQTAHHRSWLASALFRDEESLARRWPATEHALPDRWPPNGEGPRVDLLPLAVLVPPLGHLNWQVDTWAARRDRGAAPPMRHWEWRLGMRPRDVFFAQVLQFQAQLADIGQGPTADSPAATLRETIRRLAESGNEVLRDVPSGLRDAAVDDLARQARDLDGQLAKVLALQFAATGTDSGTAPGAELVELPPAGFVPGASGSLESVRQSVEAYLACPGIVGTVCWCSPGDVGGLVEAAQHRDRTPTPRSADFRSDDTATIDVYVPMRGGEPAYDWVLFTRARAVECPEPPPQEPATDTVEVIHSAVDPETGTSTDTRLGSLEYPEATWAVPDDGGGVFAEVQKLTQEVDGRFTVRAAVTSDGRRPLGYLRATLLTGPYVDGQASTTTSVETTTVAADEPETITIETGRPSDAIDRGGEPTSRPAATTGEPHPATRKAAAPPRARKAAAASEGTRP
jgi:hypothetical protein